MRYLYEYIQSQVYCILNVSSTLLSDSMSVIFHVKMAEVIEVDFGSGVDYYGSGKADG